MLFLETTLLLLKMGIGDLKDWGLMIYFYNYFLVVQHKLDKKPIFFSIFIIFIGVITFFLSPNFLNFSKFANFFNFFFNLKSFALFLFLSNLSSSVNFVCLCLSILKKINKLNLKKTTLLLLKMGIGDLKDWGLMIYFYNYFLVVQHKLDKKPIFFRLLWINIAKLSNYFLDLTILL